MRSLKMLSIALYRFYSKINLWGIKWLEAYPTGGTTCSTLGWVSVQCRACLSNHISDLTKALWLISEESSPGDLSIMSAVNLPLPFCRSIWFGLEHRKPMLNRIESIIDLQRTC
jgi:hypothetical protein